MVHTDTLVLTSDFSVSTRLYTNQKNPVTPRLDRGAHAKPQSHFAKTSNPLKPHSGYRGSQKAYGDPELKSGIREDGDRLPRYTRNDNKNNPASPRLDRYLFLQYLHFLHPCRSTRGVHSMLKNAPHNYGWIPRSSRGKVYC